MADLRSSPVFHVAGANASPRQAERMWKTFRADGRVLVFLLILHAGAACTRADASRRHFDIDGQPAAAALNEFARQADIALIFSYDTVAGARTQPLRGHYTTDVGLRRLLVGTGLDYRQVGDIFLICLPAACATVEGGMKAPGRKADTNPGWRKTPPAPSQ